MMNARLPLLVLLLAAAAPVRAADLTDFERSLEKTMQDTAPAEYTAMQKECPAKPDPLACKREHLKKFTEAYEGRVKGATIDGKKGLVGNLDPLEQHLLGQMVLSDAEFAKTFAANKAAAADPKKAPAIVSAYRGAIVGQTSAYRSKPPETTRAGLTTQIKGAQDQLKAATDCASGIMEGQTCKENTVAAKPPAKKDGKGGKDGKDGKPTTDDKTAAAEQDTKGPTEQEKARGKEKVDQKVVPPTGDLVASPPEKKDDPNKWNDTIAGAKGALYGALLGFIFGGPMGMLVFGMVGFAAMYGISKMNNS